MNSGEEKKRVRRRRKKRQITEPKGNGPIRAAKLKDWAGLTQEPDVLLIHLMLNLEHLADFLNSESIRSAEMEYLAVILEALLFVKYHEHSFNHILEVIASSRFYDVHLLGYFSESEEPLAAKMAAVTVTFAEEIARRLPSRVDVCKGFILSICMRPTLLNCRVEAVEKMINTFNAAIGENSRKDTDPSSPQGDFKELRVFPTEKDIEEGVSPFVRKNQVVGAFSDKRHYFDVVFRLMREDFFRPLRETIARCRQGNTKFSDSASIVYNNVRIVSVRLENGIEHVLLLDIKRLRAMNWDCTKYFKTGNLVCVSRDNFKTIMFGVVGFNTVRGVANGRVRVYFQNCFEAVYRISADEKLKLVESPSFFVAYRYVLEGLQDMFDLHLPMESYLVQCVTESKQTAYLTDTTCYDLSSIKGDDLKHVKWSPQQIFPNDCWPGLTKVCLNKEQYTAIKVALTRELTLLQGPPGTGKTYVSWKLMRILLENRGRGVPDNKPILVVCFTNHALDQFLEGLLPFCEQGIVRVGGRSDSKALEPFNLREISRKKRSNLISRFTKSVQRKINSIERELRNLTQKLKMFQIEIPDLDDLEDFMTEFHLKKLLGGFPQDASPTLLLRSWLNMAKDNLEASLISRIEAHLISCLMDERARQDDSCLDFSEHIPFSLKAAVYRNWAHKFENSSWELCVDKILSDDRLKPHVSPEVLTSIYGLGYESVKDWLLGRDVEEILDNIEELQEEMFENNVDEVNNDDDQEYYDSWDDDDYDDDDGFEDDTDDDDADSEDSVHSAYSAVHIILRAKSLGVDFSSEDVQTQENLTMGLSSGLIVKKLQVAKPMTEDDEGKVADVWALNSNNRYRLYKSWFNRLMASISAKIRELTDEYNLLLEQKREIRAMKDLAVLKNAKVVGMTTTGAARNRKLLRTIGPRIIVVEEAAEVLEAHIITALNEHCQHLILIGDHQQLRPRTQVYQLAQDFGLEVSMFERLVNNKFTCIQLVEQHRMRPEISVFVRLIYPDLKDSESVKGRPSVSGMDNNVFFIKHIQPENNVKNSASKLNNFEARYLIKLCEYLLMQGHRPDQITILGAYSGQVTLIQELINNSKKPLLQSVQVSTVDNFQGEQNKIILLSLVRSNAKENVGFLSTDNRVCVALSRAQYGMYVIGDIDLLVRHSDLWYKIDQMAERQGCIGNVLRLRCPNQRHVTEIVGIGDFEKVLRQRGCGQVCKDLLSCGHLCLKTCHLGGHNLVCGQACLKKCPNGHTCTGTCGEECPPCSIITTKNLPCGHVMKTKCGYPCDVICTEPCLKKCPFGHPCGLQCNVSCKPCTAVCKFLLSCGHLCLKQCHTGGHDILVCEQACLKKCPKGHTCTGKCSCKCPPCAVVVKKPLACGHSSKDKCGCPSDVVCTKPCLRKCPSGHLCGLKCNQPCQPCKKPCKLRLPCGHLCSKQCHTDGHDKFVCNQPCLKKCPSGHSCCLKCSEPCQPCKKMCKIPLPCGHLCAKRCHVDGHDKIDCNQPCLKACPSGHLCGLKCNVPCQPCTKACKIRLSCGHLCSKRCHTDGHDSIVCNQPCLKTCPNGHKCPGKCSEECPPCAQLITKPLTCGHSVETKCGYPLYHLVCTQPCLKKCPSGHPCALRCYERCQPCKLRLPCGHLSSKQCHTDGHDKIVFNQPCLKKCPSGHSCCLKCSEPCQPCKKMCKIPLPCGHLCAKRCHVDGHDKIDCNQPCLKACPSGHLCGLKCNVPCQPCTKACKIRLPCGHLCSKRCHPDGHDNIVCNQQCLKTCPNGHKCPGKCSEECPPCAQLITKPLTCGHSVEAKCGYLQYHLVCTQPCLKTCPSGHPCALKCYERCQPCTLRGNRTLPCGHEAVTACNNTKSLTCQQRCKTLCPNGHQCPAACSEKCLPCEVIVWKKLKCGHVVTGTCGYVQRCTQSCLKKCACGYSCTNKCGDPCSRCSTKLPCGHRCQGTPSSEVTSSAVKLCREPCGYRCQNHHPCPSTCCFACPSKCNQTLLCGHQCKQPFLPTDILLTSHLLYSLGFKGCDEPCMNLCERGHECLSNCSENCLPCREILDCGHVCKSVPRRNLGFFYPKKCQEKCKKSCRRGHSCPKLCCEACPDSCSQMSCVITNLFALDIGFKYRSRK